MELIAGDAREILLPIGIGDWAGLRDPTRFDAYVSLGGGMDHVWLDLFAQAAVNVPPAARHDPSARLRTLWRRG